MERGRPGGPSGVERSGRQADATTVAPNAVARGATERERAGMVDLARYDLGGTTLTRVPYFDIALGAEALGLRDADVAVVADADDPWTEGDQVLCGPLTSVLAVKVKSKRQHSM